jgi:hypothetical protein
MGMLLLDSIAVRDLNMIAMGVLVLGISLELHHLEIELLRALVIYPECVKP